MKDGNISKSITFWSKYMVKKFKKSDVLNPSFFWPKYWSTILNKVTDKETLSVAFHKISGRPDTKFPYFSFLSKNHTMSHRRRGHHLLSPLFFSFNFKVRISSN